MLKFFRRIRQKLIDEGNLKRYLIYAIGEVLLVMIGILLALQVNNWNEQVKLKREQQQYMKSLLGELDNQVKYCTSRINMAKIKRGWLDNFFEVVNNSNSTKKEIQAKSDSISNIIGYLNPPLNTIRNLIESGKINLFKHEIQVKILDYFDLFEQRFKVINENMEQIKQFRNEWFANIDLAYYKGKLNVEQQLDKAANQDRESLAFIKRTNYYMFRYDKITYMEWRLNEIKNKAVILKSEIEEIIK